MKNDVHFHQLSKIILLSVSFCTRATGRPDLFHENENETKLATCKILRNMKDIGISSHCKQKSFSSIYY